MPHGISGFGVESLNSAEEFLHLLPLCFVLVWAAFRLERIVRVVGVFLDVVLTYEAEWTDDGDRHLVERESRGHAREATFEEDVEHGSVDDVVHVVSEGDLVEIMLLRIFEDSLSPLP